MIRPAVALLMLPLAACEMPPSDPVAVADRCEEQALAALAPTGAVSVGIGSRSGPEVGASIAVSSDFLAGRDPEAVYQACVFRATGQPPVRPLRLR